MQGRGIGMTSFEQLTQQPLPGMPFRILVTGWRDWPRTAASVVHNALDAIVEELAPEATRIIVTEGECPYGGVDQYAREWAVRHEPRTVPDPHPAKWRTLGKAAGMIRNAEMVALQPDVCLAFPGPGSRGTIDCMRKAEAANILVRTFSWEEYGLQS
jgi:hypothetical protein